MLAIGCDHAAVDLKNELLAHLASRQMECFDFGAREGEKVDYPVPACRVATAVVEGKCERGVLLCGTGVGISIAANKVRGIRACCCSEPFSAKLSKQHNDSNILCMGARVVGTELAKMILDAWLDAEYEGGRHADRVAMLAAMEVGTFRC
ncbi:MAG: ribose 5-phosphate isomerase B [Oscillospiraceae bacterium]|jgi:ribose 5-phosphate isomerase B|nr:ribose 5-phosphate isomerase B [Oscillospiraceae bacterium]